MAIPRKTTTTTASTVIWRGRMLALVGIVLVALNLRTAIGSVSPVIAQINVDVPIDDIRLGVIGMLPPVCFAVFGLLSPPSSRKLGLELTTILAVGLMAIGQLTRGFADNYPVLLVGSVLAFAGTGMGNALLPPLVKRYFPDRVGMLTSLYAGALSVSAFLPPLIAVPIAESPAGWHVSLAVWGVFAAIAAVPWLLMLRTRSHGERGAGSQSGGQGLSVGFLLRSKIAWSIVIVFAASSMTMYAVFAWLPLLLVQTAGVSAVGAGALLALYAAVGFPASMIVPILVARTNNVTVLVAIGALGIAFGTFGFVFFPAAAPWLWVVGLALGRMLFPVAMTLVNVRTTTHQNSLNLSGFVNGVGYTLGLFGPLLFGVLHDASGAWMLPLLFLLVPTAAAVIMSFFLAKPRPLDQDPVADPSRPKLPVGEEQLNDQGEAHLPSEPDTSPSARQQGGSYQQPWHER